MKHINIFAISLFAMMALNMFHFVVNMKYHDFNVPYAGSITFGHMRYVLQKKSRLNFERIQMQKKEEEEESERRRIFFNENLVFRLVASSSILRDFYAGRF